jgi:SMODS and SLOG-associating 2TM effector domain 1
MTGRHAGGDAQRRAQFLDLYLRHRLGDQMRWYERRQREYRAARSWTVTASAVLLSASALFGALGVADPARRPAWAFAATALAALATAIAGYEAAFGFESLARRYGDTAATLHLLSEQGPRPPDVATPLGADRLASFVNEVESALTNEVGSWPQSVGQPDRGTAWQHTPDG